MQGKRKRKEVWPKVKGPEGFGFKRPRAPSPSKNGRSSIGREPRPTRQSEETGPEDTSQCPKGRDTGELNLSANTWLFFFCVSLVVRILSRATSRKWLIYAVLVAWNKDR